MVNNKIIREAENHLEKPRIRDSLKTYGKPLFYTVFGSHNYGFASEKSDIDIRGVYIAPTRRFLGIRSNVSEPSFVYFSPDRRVELLSEEIGKFLSLIAKSNGERIEWINTDSIFSGTSELENLRDTINRFAISKNLAKYYQTFARSLRENQKLESEVKCNLHTLRAYMTGIYLMETGRVISDLTKLNERFSFEIIPNMIEAKRGRGEYSSSELSRLLEFLDEEIVRAADKSTLPIMPNREMISRYLTNLRIKEI